MPINEQLFMNALDIPVLFSSPFETVRRIGLLLFSVMLIVAILHENFEALRGRSDYSGLFLRVILITSLMVLYDRFFIWMVYGMDLMAEAILPHEEFKETVMAVFHEIGERRDFGVLKVFSIITVLNFLTYVAALSVLALITWLRFIFLSLLFVFGPILVGAACYKGSSQGLTFWLRSLVSVSSWTVVLSILMKVISVMNLTSIYLPEETNTVAVFSANVLFILLFISVPLISHQVTSSGTLSGLGSAVIGIGTAIVTKTVIRPLIKYPVQHEPPQPGKEGS